MTVADGNDLEALEAALRAAQAVTDKPSLISVKTIIGYGMPAQGTSKAHSDAPGAEAVRATKKALGWPAEASFLIPDAALAHFRASLARGAQLEQEWNDVWARYSAAHAEAAQEFSFVLNRELPDDWENHLPDFKDAPAAATRAFSGQVINALAPHLPQLLGGSADLAPSNNTDIKSSHGLQPASYEGRILHFGVREHAMGAAMVGINRHSGLIPFGGTFMTFADYMKPAIRLAALSEAQVIFVFTHDSIGVGEDGPTHQPIEQLAMLRAIPHLYVIRPADAHETREAWRIAIQRRNGPTALAFTRQKVALIDRAKYAPAEMAQRGGYILAEATDAKGQTATPSIILLATGSEVGLALEARIALQAVGTPTRVVSLPCWELFDEQPLAYRETVLPPEITARLAIEAGASLGWHKYTGLRGDTLTLDRFGASSPAEDVFRELGFSVENVMARALEQF